MDCSMWEAPDFSAYCFLAMLHMSVAGVAVLRFAAALRFGRERADAACHSCVKSCGRFKCQTWWSGWQPCQFERAMVGWLSGCLSVQLAAPLHTQAKWIVGSDRRRQAAQFGRGYQEGKLCKRKNNERPFFGKHAGLKNNLVVRRKQRETF